MKNSVFTTWLTEDIIHSIDLSDKIDVMATIGTICNSIEKLLQTPDGEIDYTELVKLTTLYAAMKAVYEHRWSDE